MQDSLLNHRLTSDSTLCLEVDKRAKRQNIAPAEICKKAFVHCGNRDEVIACQLDELIGKERENGEKTRMITLARIDSGLETPGRVPLPLDVNRTEGIVLAAQVQTPSDDDDNGDWVWWWNGGNEANNGNEGGTGGSGGDSQESDSAEGEASWESVA